MGITININGNMEKMMNEYQKKTIKQLEQKISEITPKIESDVVDLVEEKLKTFFIESVSQFYKSYEPNFYKRRGRLENLLRIKKGDKQVKYWFEPSELAYRTGYDGEKGLYKTVFIEGWHGGANMKGNISYPYKKNKGDYVQYNGGDNGKPYEDYYNPWRWRPAERSLSPYDMFITLKKDYEEKGFRKDYKQICIEHFRRNGIQIN